MKLSEPGGQNSDSARSKQRYILAYSRLNNGETVTPVDSEQRGRRSLYPRYPQLSAYSTLDPHTFVFKDAA